MWAQEKERKKKEYVAVFVEVVSVLLIKGKKKKDG